MVWGDGAKIDRQIIPATDLTPLGRKRFEIPFDATGKKWVRFAAWDTAGNGAMVQPVTVDNGGDGDEIEKPSFTLLCSRVLAFARSASARPRRSLGGGGQVRFWVRSSRIRVDGARSRAGYSAGRTAS